MDHPRVFAAHLLLRLLSVRTHRTMPVSHPAADNEFTGTTELEFFDAQGTVWTGNTLPSSGVCVDNITSDDGISIDESTFTSSDGLPAAC